MNHQQATSTSAAERYLLDEMTADERGQFEEHFFSCRECGDDMQSAALLIDGIRATCAESKKVVQFSPRKSSAFRIPSWIPSAAAAAFAAVVCYQSLVIIPGLKNDSDARQVSVYLLRPETRGDARAIVREPGQPVTVSLDLPTIPSSNRLEAVVQTAQGEVVRIPVNLANGESRVFVRLPSTLPVALYTIVLRSNETEVGRYQLQLSDR